MRSSASKRASYRIISAVAPVVDYPVSLTEFEHHGCVDEYDRALGGIVTFHSHFIQSSSGVKVEFFLSMISRQVEVIYGRTKVEQMKRKRKEALQSDVGSLLLRSLALLYLAGAM